MTFNATNILNYFFIIKFFVAFFYDYVLNLATMVQQSIFYKNKIFKYNCFEDWKLAVVWVVLTDDCKRLTELKAVSVIIFNFVAVRYV